MTYSIDNKTWRSPNHNPRTQRLESVVVHSCEGALPNPRESSLPWLCKPASPTHTNPVSCHYYVCRDTTIFQLVDDNQAAWHAGNAQARFDNESSLGIECEHRSGQDWPAAQKDALTWLVKQLIASYAIPTTSIETHGQIAIEGPYIRKVDPSNWPHQDFVAWRTTLATKSYRALGIPVYQQSTRTGPLWGHLQIGEVITIDDPNNGHLEDERGFIRSDPDTLEPL